MKKRTMGLLGASAAVLVALTGCSQVAASTPSHAQDAAAAMKKAIASEKPLTILASPVGNYVDNLSPYSSSAGDTGQVGLIYQPLFYFDSVTTAKVPLLATSYGWSNGNTTLTVHLRKGVKWSDGKAFTSNDVVFTFMDMKKYPAADGNGVWNNISGVKANGPDEVIFTFKKPNVPYASYILGQYILPEHQWKSLGDPTKAIIKEPIGTGPYILLSFNPENIQYRANLQYWGGVPAVRNVDYPAFSGNDSADLALAKGQVDWSGIFIPSIQSVFTSKSQYNKYWFPAGNVIMLYPNLKVPGLNDFAVREAMSLAINRTQLANEGEYGYTTPAQPSGLLPSQVSQWGAPGLPTSFTYNDAKAVQILEKAGYKKDSAGIFAKNGKELAFTLQVPSGWSDWDTDVSLISQEEQQIGIKVTADDESQSSYFANIFSPKKPYQLVISWTNAGPSPFFLYNSLLNSKGGSFNEEQLSNATVDSALNQFASSGDLSKQKQSLYTIERYLANQLPSIPLFYGPTWYEYNDQNYTGWPSASNPYIDPAPFNNVSQAIVLMHLKPRT